VKKRIRKLASTEWVDEFCMTWLQSAPHIKLLNGTNNRKQYPLSWDAQKAIFDAPPEHLAKMALFRVNTDCGDGEIRYLPRSWIVDVLQTPPSVALYLIADSMIKQEAQPFNLN